jgi:plastocyanin
MRPRGGLVMLLLVGVLALAGCGGDDEGGGSASATTAAPETTSAPTTTAAAGGADDEVQLAASGFAWNPSSFELPAGTEVKVEVTNQDQAPHTFTFEEAGADQQVAAGEDATVTFTSPAAGSYQFRCKIHPAMRGTITVA